MAYMNRVKREIKSLEKAGGIVTPEIVYDYARSKPGSALHEYLKEKEVWDKDKAQHHYAITVCRELIRRIRIVEENQEYVVRVKTPQYIRNPDAEHNEASYINVDVLRNNKDKLRESLIPYVERGIANLQTAMYLSEDTGCTEYLKKGIQALNDLVKKIQENKGKAVKKVRPTVAQLRKLHSLPKHIRIKDGNIVGDDATL